jgi:hypothetical protein
MTSQTRPFQFSLRSIFIVTTLLAMVCSGLFAGPPEATVLTGVLLALLTPAGFAVTIVYGRGYLRTFSIGAMFPAAVQLFWPVAVTGVAILNPYDFRADIVGSFRRFPPLDLHAYVACVVLAATTAILVCGLFAMLVRWLVERQPGAEEAAGERVAAAGDATASNRGDEPPDSVREV